MLIQWSDEDGAFLVMLPEWEARVFNPVTHGSTDEEARHNGRIALKDLVSLAREQDRHLPEPGVLALSA